MTDLSVGRNELSRFEKPDFIHSFLIEGTSKVKHELERYGPRFIEENSAVHSPEVLMVQLDRFFWEQGG